MYRQIVQCSRPNREGRLRSLLETERSKLEELGIDEPLQDEELRLLRNRVEFLLAAAPLGECSA